MALMDRFEPMRAAPGRTALLAAGDVLAFAVFAAVGRSSHGQSAGLDAALEVLTIAAPFALSWLAVAPFVGVFREAVATQPLPALKHTALAWALAIPIGMALRAFVWGRGVQPTFVVITFLTVLIILGGWRAAYAWLAQRGARRAN